MNTITMVSEISRDDLADYLRLIELTTDEQNTLDTLLVIAKNYIKQYTGQNDLDLYQDFVIVVFILVQDMWDNRVMYVDNNNLNYVIRSILDMHSVNLL